MKLNDRFIRDVSLMASGAASVLAGSRPPHDPVSEPISRAEFDAAVAMAAKARDTQEALASGMLMLEARVAKLEAEISRHSAEDAQ